MTPDPKDIVTPTPGNDVQDPGPDTLDGIDDVIQHTDSGSGASQLEHWTPNVEGPDAEPPTQP